jgi:nicotinamidase-related amidase
VKTIVATGVSVNLGVFGLCLEAVNLGYRVILPRDCVAGYPKEYADALIGNSLAQLCTITDRDTVLGAWG